MRHGFLTEGETEHFGEFMAAWIFDIALEPTANRAVSMDGSRVGHSPQRH